MFFESLEIMFYFLNFIHQPSCTYVPDLDSVRLSIQSAKIRRKLTRTLVFLNFTIPQQVSLPSLWSFYDFRVGIVVDTLCYKPVFKVKSALTVMLVSIEIWIYTYYIGRYKSTKLIVNGIIFNQIIEH